MATSGFKLKYDKSTFPFKSPLNQKKAKTKKIRIAGEETGPIKTDDKGKDYSIYGEGADWGLNDIVNPGDTIFPGNKNVLISSLDKDHPVKPGPGDDDYIMGGDYDLEETDSSKKRKKGPKSYKTK